MFARTFIVDHCSENNREQSRNALCDETQQLLQMYFLLEYWGNEYNNEAGSTTDSRCGFLETLRLELPFANASGSTNLLL